MRFLGTYREDGQYLRQRDILLDILLQVLFSIGSDKETAQYSQHIGWIVWAFSCRRGERWESAGALWALRYAHRAMVLAVSSTTSWKIVL